jgi:hypothetical protein
MDNADAESPMDIVRELRTLLADQLGHERARADRAEAAADKFRTEAEAARADATAARAEAGRLREADEVRRARPLLARLKAAWRGE